MPSRLPVLDDCIVVSLAASYGPSRHPESGVRIKPHEKYPCESVRMVHSVPRGVQALPAYSIIRGVEIFVAIKGRIQLTLEDRFESCTLDLDRPFEGVVVQPWIWRYVHAFTDHAILAILEEEAYNERNFIRTKWTWRHFRHMAPTQKEYEYELDSHGRHDIWRSRADGIPLSPPTGDGTS